MSKQSNTTNRGLDKYRQMFDQQQMIEERRKAISEKNEGKKRREAEEKLIKSHFESLKAELISKKEDEDDGPKKTNIFLNDGSFMEQFKKLSNAAVAANQDKKPLPIAVLPPPVVIEEPEETKPEPEPEEDLSKKSKNIPALMDQPIPKPEQFSRHVSPIGKAPPRGPPPNQPFPGPGPPFREQFRHSFNNRPPFTSGPNFPGGGPPPPSNFQNGPPQNFPPNGPPQNFQSGPPQNFQGGPPQNFQGGTPQNFQGGPPPPNFPSGPPQNFQGGPPQNFQGGPQPNFQGNPPQNFQHNGPSQNFQGSGPTQNFQSGPPQNYQGSHNFSQSGPNQNFPPGPPQNFASTGPPQNFTSAGPPPNFPQGSGPGGPPPGFIPGGPPGPPFPSGPPPPGQSFPGPPGQQFPPNFIPPNFMPQPPFPPFQPPLPPFTSPNQSQPSGPLAPPPPPPHPIPSPIMPPEGHQPGPVPPPQPPQLSAPTPVPAPVPPPSGAFSSSSLLPPPPPPSNFGIHSEMPSSQGNKPDWDDEVAREDDGVHDDEDQGQESPNEEDSTHDDLSHGTSSSSHWIKMEKDDSDVDEDVNEENLSKQEGDISNKTDEDMSYPVKKEPIDNFEPINVKVENISNIADDKQIKMEADIKQENVYTSETDIKSEKDIKTEVKTEPSSSARGTKRRSRWGDATHDVKPPGVVSPAILANAAVNTPSISVTGMSGHLLSKVNKRDKGLLQYAMSAYGSCDLSEEDWKKAEDNYKIHLLYQDMMQKRAEVERLQAQGKNKYEYDSDEDIEGGTWEHKAREKEMIATKEWASKLTEMARGKHHIGDFLPPEELKKFMDKYTAVKGGGSEPDLSDYKEFKLTEENKGFQMLQKLGWTEGQGLGADGSGIVEPVNKARNRDTNMGLGVERPDDLASGDDEYEAYRKRMMLAYRFRPNPLNNPRRPYY